MYPVVGYFGSGRPPAKTLAPEDSTLIPDSETLLALDSGRRVTLSQGTRSVIVMGGTGSGKTRSVVLPMIDNLIRNGLSGLILDVKGNLRTQVRAIAEAHGRLDDIVEFGTHPSSHTTDYLAGLKDHEVSDLMEMLAVDGIGTTGNLNFYLHGGRIYYDVYHCLKDISRIHPNCHFSKQFRPTLAKIYRIVNNNSLAQGLWTFYLESLKNALYRYNGQPPQYLADAKSFANIVASDNFHVLKEAKEYRNSNYWDQLSYAVNHINGAFKSIEMTHNLLDRFSSQSKESLPMNFDKLIYNDNKIVLVHFAMDSGYAGDVLSRNIKSKFYQSVIRNGLKSKQLTFFVADEFQAIVDVSKRSKLNDMDFFSISREYKNINIIATQSIASLMSKGDSHSITSLLANCMTKIVLQCSDPATNEWLHDVCEHHYVPLKFMKRGCCFIECLDHEGLLEDRGDSLNAGYTIVDNLLKNYREVDNKNYHSIKPSYAIGPAGLPYVITEILLADPPKTTPNLSDDTLREFDRYSQWIYAELDTLRDLSREGLNYWSVEPPRPAYKCPPRRRRNSNNGLGV